MTIFLNGLMVFMSVLFFAGRLYEVTALMDAQTGFLSAGAIVTSPLMLRVLFLMSVCCGILLFASDTKKVKPARLPMGIFGFAIAIPLAASSVMNIIEIFRHGGFLGYDIMIILSGVGLAAYSVMNIRGKKSESIPFILVLLLPVAMCMDCIILNIRPISNTEFLIKALCAVVCMIFFTLLFKTAYAPGRFSRMGLYVFSLITFMLCAAANLAGAVGAVMNGSFRTADLLYKAGMVVLGTYALFIAFYIVPSKEDKEEKEQRPQAAGTAPTYENTGIYRRADRISKDTVARLFAQKDSREHEAKKYSGLTGMQEDALSQQSASRADIDNLFSSGRSRDSHSGAKTTVRSSSVKKQSTAAPVYKSERSKKSDKKIVYKAPK